VPAVLVNMFPKSPHFHAFIDSNVINDKTKLI
jgi:hypothetical protein